MGAIEGFGARYVCAMVTVLLAFKGVEIPMTNTLRKDSGAAAVSKPQAAEPQEAKTYVCGDKEVYDYFVLLLNLLIPEIQDVLQA